MGVRLFFLLTIVAAATVIVSCQHSAYYGQDITPELYPDNSAVVLSRSRIHTCEFVAELLRTYRYEVVEYTTIEDCTRIKILTENGLEKFGNMVSPVFRKKNSKYEVEARVIAPDGKSSTVEAENITRIDIGKQYEQYRIAFPSLRVGSVIELKEKIKSQYGDMAGRWDFAHEVPTLKSDLVFKIPSGSKVRFNYIPPREGVTEIEPNIEGKYDIYRFTMENIPPFRDEPLMSAEHEGNPTLLYYTFHIPNETMEKAINVDPGTFTGQPFYMTWNNIAKTYAAYYERTSWSSEEESDNYRNAKSKMVDEFKGGTFADTESMLREFVQHFRESFQPIEGGYFIRASNPEEAYVNREGNSFELAYVMREMLNDLGIAASVVLVRDISSGLLDRKMPDMLAFTDAILHIEYGGKEYWIDPGTHVCRFDQVPWLCRGVDGLWLLPNGEFVFKKVAMRNAEYNRIVNVEEVEFTERGGINGVAKVTISGQNLIRLRKTIDQDEEERFTEKLIDLFKDHYGSEFEEEELTVMDEWDDSLVVNYRYGVPDFADMAAGFMNVDFSRWIGLSYLDVFDSEDRKFDINFPFLRCDRVCVRMKLPQGIEAVEIPRDVSKENDHFTYTRSIEMDGDVVTFKRSMVLKNSTIPAADYPGVKEFIGEIYKLDRETMVLKSESL